ncbi:MAG: hypothetical protein K9M44_03895 [Candidatus Pacebacteria bacterium]|nr:hypothetical protein [Candidatus Paceibacterota bacterium]
MTKDLNSEKQERILAIKKIYQKSLLTIEKIKVERDEEVAKILKALDSHSIISVLNDIKSME